MAKFSRLILIIFLNCIGILQFSYAQKNATTEDGNKVLLYDNGTWKYADNSSNRNFKYCFTLTINFELQIGLKDGLIVDFGTLNGGAIQYNNCYNCDDKGKVSNIEDYKIIYNNCYNCDDKGKISKIEGSMSELKVSFK